MLRRITGLRAECALLDKEIANCETGGHREIDALPNSTRIDITDLHITHLKDVLVTKLRYMGILESRLAQGT